MLDYDGRWTLWVAKGIAMPKIKEGRRIMKLDKQDIALVNATMQEEGRQEEDNDE